MVEPMGGNTRPHPDDAAELLSTDFDRSSLGQLRGALTRCGADAGLTDLNLSNFVLAVNEITTNAVRYGGGRGTLRLWRDGGFLCCAVADTGPGIPARYLAEARRPEPGTIGGHGLWLARHICASVDIDTRPRHGTTVVLRYRLP